MGANTYGRQVVESLVNKSGGSVAAGDVVIIDTTNDGAFTTTTTARSEVTIGVAQETIASNATGRVLLSGYAALVNVPASVTRGHYVETHTVAKQATGNSTRRSGSFGQFRTGGTTPTAVLWGNADQTATAAATPDCYQSILTTPVTMTNANQFYDGPSITPVAGVYLVTLEIDIGQTHASGTNHTARIIHNSVVQKARNCISGSGGGNATAMTVTVRMTADGTNAIIGQAAANRASDSTILDTANVNGTTDKCTSITAIRVTSA